MPVEIGDEIVRMLEPDVEAYDRACRLPSGRGADAGRIDRQRQTLEAAPAVSDAEMLQSVDQRRARCRITAVEDDRE